MLGHKSICFGGFPRMARLMPAAWLVFLSLVRAGCFTSKLDMWTDIKLRKNGFIYCLFLDLFVTLSSDVFI